MTDKWKIISESIIGHSHVRKNLPNQDAIFPTPGSQDSNDYPIIAAIADGHGGKNYFRSDRGSGFACDAAVESLSIYFDQDPTLSTPHVRDAICREITKKWKTFIIEDIKKYPYSSEESAIIEEGKSVRKFNLPRDSDYDQIRPYGSTVLSVIITESYAFFFQLGDGDIITHEGENEFSKVIQADEKMVGNETYSLCMPDSWRDFKVKRVEAVPDFIMLSTDGYANSFIDDVEFIVAARDLYSFIYQAEDFDTGVSSVQSNLKDWLSVTSQKGSGDDISVCMIARDTSNNKGSKKKSFKRNCTSSENQDKPPKSYTFLRTQPASVSELNSTKQPKKSREISSPESLPIKGQDKPPVSPRKKGGDITPQTGKIFLSHRTIIIIGIVILLITIIGLFLVSSMSQERNLNVTNDSGISPQSTSPIGSEYPGSPSSVNTSNAATNQGDNQTIPGGNNTSIQNYMSNHTQNSSKVDVEPIIHPAGV